MNGPNMTELTKVLYGRKVRASDFRVVPGPRTGSVDADARAGALLASMERLGIVRDGELVDPNRI